MIYIQYTGYVGSLCESQRGAGPHISRFKELL